MAKVPEMFGCMVFNDTVMQERLPKDTYKALKKYIADNKALDQEVANVVANAMKDWALEHGVTHYTQRRAGRFQLPFRRLAHHL